MAVLDNIPVLLKAEDVLRNVRIRNVTASVEQAVQELLGSVLPVARPKVLYKVAYIENKSADSVEISGVRFTSSLLRKNLDGVERVFPYIATCGRELDAFKISPDDIMENYYLDTIKRMVLHTANEYLRDYLVKTYALGRISRMNPGSLEAWPITQQKELFSLFGNVEGLIGVRLTESYLMVPVKSSSGIIFPTEVRFESCQLCPREGCSGRRVPYDAELVEKYQKEGLLQPSD